MSTDNSRESLKQGGWMLLFISMPIALLIGLSFAWNAISEAGEKQGSTLNNLMWGGCSPKAQAEFNSHNYILEEKWASDDPCAPPNPRRRISEEEYNENLEIEEKQRQEFEKDRNDYFEQWETDSGSGGGQCAYDPTMNYDWHDDYVCGGVRQYFLPNDDHVDQWEIDAAAAEWEANH